MGILEAGLEDATAVLMLPERYRKRLRTTNGMERLNEEIHRRDRVIRIFANWESVVRLIGALIDEKWASGKKYLDMTEYLAWQQTQVQERKTVKALGYIWPRIFHTNMDLIMPYCLIFM
jgi:putative transposase